MAFTDIPIEELRNRCRRTLETLELWLRRLIHDKLSVAYGNDYLEQVVNGNTILSKDVCRRATTRMQENPNRYSRLLDALILEDLVGVLCKEDLFKLHFRDAFANAFPDGRVEMRTYLRRLVDIRNPLSHANPISNHQALRVFCYTEDVIQSITKHYEVLGMSKEYNSPVFVAFRDSQGNEGQISNSHAKFLYLNSSLRPGDQLRLEVDVDDSFPADSYEINWTVNNIRNGETGNGASFVLELNERHVSEIFSVSALLVSKKKWHRHANFDARLTISYRVLPPL